MWSSKSLGSKYKYGFFQLLIRLHLIPLARLLLFPISFYYSLRPSLRKRCSYFLQHRFPAETQLWRFLRTSIIYFNFAQVLFDRLLIASGMEVPIKHDLGTLKILSKILKNGKGCIIVAAHFGCWQTALTGLELLGRPISVIFWREENIDQRYFGYARKIEMIDACQGVETVVRIRNSLRNNGILCIMGDRMTHADKKFSEVEFLGGKIQLPVFPYILSELLGAPVVHTASIKKSGRVCGLPAVVSPGGEKAPAFFAEYLERLVTEHPHHFYNFYDMWERNDKRRNT